jgi:alpha-N-arabinofuranosidase
MSDYFINPKRLLAERDIMIYGHFLEHFHRQIYGGVFEPGSKLSDGRGFRMDVLEALRKIKAPVIRWPGGCFVSSYDWKLGVGPNREPVYDKAWRVEESNRFGTDEFHQLCDAVGAEMYICTNAGTGAAEQMSDWLEYTNLDHEGRYARQRIQNGYRDPYGVKYFSIGNENYGSWELGAKERHEWALLVTESAKLLKHVDPTVQLSAAALPDPEWNLELIKHAGPYLSWISIHEYWDAIHTTNALASYEQAMAYTARLDESIERVEGILAATGYLGKIKIAFDEWNLRGWYHPNAHGPDIRKERELYLTPRDQNDDNSAYTMADTVFTACFLNTLLRHSQTVKMANYAPSVNTRGLIYTHEEGIVLRGTYHVFDLFVNQMGERVIDLWDRAPGMMPVAGKDGKELSVCAVDAVATLRSDGRIALSLINKHPTDEAIVNLHLADARLRGLELHCLHGDSTEAYNSIETPDRVRIHVQHPAVDQPVTLPPHSVSVLVAEME